MDIADFVATLDKEQVLVVFRVLPKDLAADVFAYLDPEFQEHSV